MNETLQEKIDANFRRLCEFHFDGYQAELDTWSETNETLQEFREQVLELKSHKSSGMSKTDEDQAWGYGYQTAIIDVLALIGENNNE